MHGVRSVKMVGQPIVTTELRAPTVSAAATVRDKAVAWSALAGALWSDRLEEKLSTLLSEVQ